MNVLDYYIGVPIAGISRMKPSADYKFSLDLENGVEIRIQNHLLTKKSIIGMVIGKVEFVEPDHVLISVGTVKPVGAGSIFEVAWLIDVLADQYSVVEGEITHYPIPASPEPPPDPSLERVAAGPQEGDTGDEQPEPTQDAPNG